MRYSLMLLTISYQFLIIISIIFAPCYCGDDDQVAIQTSSAYVLSSVTHSTTFKNGKESRGDGNPFEDYEDEYQEDSSASTPLIPPDNTTMDLLVENDIRIKLRLEEDRGVTCKIFTPREGVCIRKIVCGKALIWESSNWKCMEAEVFTSEEFSVISTVWNKGRKSEYRYFEKENDAWKSIDPLHFDRMLYDMMYHRKQCNCLLI